VQRRFTHRALLALAVVGLVACVFAAVGLGAVAKLRGKITADGSSTLGPYVTAAAERFQKRNTGVQITIGISGTGGGFERFCKGETDLSNASRPMKQSEAKACRENGLRYEAFLLANDGISIVANKANTWLSCLTVDELRKIWDSGSKVDNWKDVRSSFPSVPLKLYGPGTDSGTFDFFTEHINGKAKRSRADYVASENDNVLVRGVAGDRGGLGYFGYSYYTENKSRLKLVAVNAGGGCVRPSLSNIQSYRYKPLSRPLFVYAKRSSFHRAAVQGFIRFMIQNERSIARTAKFVSLTPRQLRKARYQYDRALRAARAG
jgi:phosphate transport system substrate-binding protein